MSGPIYSVISTLRIPKLCELGTFIMSMKSSGFVIVNIIIEHPDWYVCVASRYLQRACHIATYAQLC
jgi:hypothetical protein